MKNQKWDASFWEITIKSKVLIHVIDQLTGRIGDIVDAENVPQFKKKKFERKGTKVCSIQNHSIWFRKP